MPGTPNDAAPAPPRAQDEKHNGLAPQVPKVRTLLAVALLAMTGLAGCINDLPFVGGPDLPGDYIVDDEYAKWTIEVDYVQGHRPDGAAIDLLRNRMSELVQKDSITVVVDDVLQDGRDTWNDSQIRALSEQQRDNDHGDGTVVTHVLYLDGAYSKGSVLGITYGDKELVAIFDETIGNAANLIFSSRQIEQAVLVHEFGHVIGLVNSGTAMASPHEDADHRGHSNNDQSVMYWAVETTDITRIFTGGLPTRFDAKDKADICQAGGRC